jgi:hypothetical protein
MIGPSPLYSGSLYMPIACFKGPDLQVFWEELGVLPSR